MVELFKAGKISEARKLICAQLALEEMEDIFRWCYDNLEVSQQRRRKTGSKQF